ncbi:MAG TPA: hypothetical protein VLB46_15235 [Pyrinomonadaceae bacterium]|nr:hypothetical protein [Pyrinomonadaceae bacterium]
MHNCSETKDRLIEMVLNGTDRETELDGCAECRAEFDTLNATLRMTQRVRDMVTPPESYWTDYHARLRQKIVMSEGISHAKAQRRKLDAEKTRASALRLFLAPLRLCVRTAVPVPLPLVVLTILAFAALSVFLVRAARRPANPSQVVVHVPVEVPVVQEKVVTRVVYRDRRSTSRTSRHVTSDANAESTFARSRKPAAEEIPASLNGFKPTEEVKLTVIKGGAPNEK